MASIHETTAGFTIHWRYARQQFNQSAGTISRQEAEAIKGRIEDAISALRQGWLKLPDGADYDSVKRFIFTGGRKVDQDAIAAPRCVLTLEGLFAQYRESRPSNEESTLYTETIHQNHMLRIMVAGKDVESIVFGDIQQYAHVRKRGYESYRVVGRGTIEKELKTLGKVWNWALHRELITKPKPWQFKNVDAGRDRPRERFRDYDEITEIVRVTVHGYHRVVGR